MNSIFTVSNNIYGTSFHNYIIRSSVEKLTTILGEPNKNIDVKTNYEWRLKYNNIAFTLYDYKEYKNIKETDIVDFHIGTIDKFQSIIIYKLLNKLLNK